jgi:hypothetical protein
MKFTKEEVTLLAEIVNLLLIEKQNLSDLLSDDHSYIILSDLVDELDCSPQAFSELLEKIEDA